MSLIEPVPFNEEKDPVSSVSELLEYVEANGKYTYPSAAVLSTVFEDIPSSRVILIKEINKDGFIFYTNYEGRKSYEIELNPNGSLVFFWEQHHLQIRVVGNISKVSAQKSKEYFESRSHESQVASIVSQQSTPIESYERLVSLYEGVVKDPDYHSLNWGGYALHPKKIEFWFEAEHRLHLRHHYTRKSDGSWHHQILQP